MQKKKNKNTATNSALTINFQFRDMHIQLFEFPTSEFRMEFSQQQQRCFTLCIWSICKSRMLYDFCAIHFRE